VNLSIHDTRILQHFFASKPVKKAYLFGSYARNEAESGSDVDLLVELDYTKHIGLGFIKMKMDLEDLLSRKVDLVSEDGLSKYIRPIVDKEKILIYEGSA
jgi:predicted nucleotidyltransferase